MHTISELIRMFPPIFWQYYLAFQKYITLGVSIQNWKNYTTITEVPEFLNLMSHFGLKSGGHNSGQIQLILNLFLKPCLS